MVVLKVYKKNSVVPPFPVKVCPSVTDLAPFYMLALNIFLGPQYLIYTSKLQSGIESDTVRTIIYLSCIVCNFWSFYFRNYVSIFQEHSKNTKIQVYILPFS